MNDKEALEEAYNERERQYRKIARSRFCGKCGAEVGAPCVSGNGKKQARFHADRISSIPKEIPELMRINARIDRLQERVYGKR
jgi:hypothetical protein